MLKAMYNAQTMRLVFGLNHAYDFIIDNNLLTDYAKAVNLYIVVHHLINTSSKCNIGDITFPTNLVADINLDRLKNSVDKMKEFGILLDITAKKNCFSNFMLVCT